MLDAARFAPSGGNRQGWKVIIVRNQASRDRIGELVAPVMRQYLAQVGAGETPFNVVRQTKVDLDEAAKTPGPADEFVRFVSEAPVVLAVCVDLGLVTQFDKDLERPNIIGGGSIYPFVHNILLATRDAGLGGALTTFLAAREPEAKELLGVPDDHAICAVVPLGYPIKHLTKLSRKPVEAFTTIDSFTGEPFMPAREG